MGGKNPKRNWYRIITEKEDQGERSLPKPSVAGNVPTSNRAVTINKISEQLTKATVAKPSNVARPPSPENASPERIIIEDRSFIRKRKGGQRADKGNGAKKGKSTEALPHSLSGGIWTPAFYLGHKIDFQLAEDEEKMVQNMSE
ncbi:hypothetical protein V8G54_029074 [Vigna mungo]|uniref:Uncharacterized protein n=1 Tax=Vigna mungo TaxID=3915 RepID=A0AAQ3MU00_VIGMU